MKQIFDHRIYLSFDNGKTWEDTSILKHWVYLRPELTKENSCTVHTYDQARRFVRDSLIPNAEIGRTIFGSECIELTTDQRMWHPVRLTHRRFRPFQIKTIFEPIPNQKSLGFHTLISLLSFNDLSEYMRDHGVSWLIPYNHTQEVSSHGS